MQPDFLSPKWRQDPYPLYAWLRENQPVHWNDTWRGWLLTRHEDVFTALRDPRLSLGGGISALFDRMPAERLRRYAILKRHIGLWMGSLDTENHLRVRRAFQEGFRAPYLDDFRSQITLAANDLIGGLRDKREFDILSAFAYPVSAIAMGQFFGAPIEDWQRFRGWADVLNKFLSCGVFADEILETTQDTVIEMTDYFRQFLGDIAAGRGATGLLNRARCEELTTDEIIASCVVLLFGGYETTATLMGNCVYALKLWTDAWPRIGDDLNTLNAAVDETLRFDAPIQMVRRCAVVDLEFGGKLIKAGDVVWLVLGSANRDAEAFEDPDTFSLNRERNRHVAFGFGSHLCVGAALSRIEAATAIGALSQAMPQLTLTNQVVQWHQSPVSRSLVSLSATPGRAPLVRPPELARRTSSPGRKRGTAHDRH